MGTKKARRIDCSAMFAGSRYLGDVVRALYQFDFNVDHFHCTKRFDIPAQSEFKPDLEILTPDGVKGYRLFTVHVQIVRRGSLFVLISTLPRRRLRDTELELTYTELSTGQFDTVVADEKHGR